MDTRPSLALDAGEQADAEDFQLCDIGVSPTSRTLHGPDGSLHLQPKVMQVLLCLARGNGRVIFRRDLFDACWPAGGVGDDSLNRTLKTLRHALRVVGSVKITIETVPRTGYRLIQDHEQSEQVVHRNQLVRNAIDCWRLGLPQSELGIVNALEELLHAAGGSAEDWGVLALLLRRAVEYAEPGDCADLVGRCEGAVRQAHELNPREIYAKVALRGLTPLFGHWTTVRRGLLEALEESPANAVALHDLAVLEMSSGRPSAAAPIVDQLLARDELAATYHYKRMYHLWTFGDVEGAEQLAGRALALWPQHPAILMARFWILIFTGRAEQAERVMLSEDCVAVLPLPLIQFLKTTARHKHRASVEDCRPFISTALSFATCGPAQAVAGLLALCSLDAVEEAFEVAFGYYLGRGTAAAPLRWNRGDPSITDQYRRVTQPLFIPATRCLRQDPRFVTLCADIGLTTYWNRFGIIPDFANESFEEGRRAARDR